LKKFTAWVSWQTVRDFFYGLTGYEFAQHARAMRRETEAIFLIVTMGDLVGIPIMPPIYALRLLPYIAPEITAWKRQLARRKEFWDKEEYDLRGV
jgi:hypothetical protein